MSLLAATSTGATSLLAAVLLGVLGIWCLLPSPRPRTVMLGTFACLAGLVIFAVWLVNRFGLVSASEVARLLFWLFAGSAIIFSGVFITQRNPARGAIAFAFTIVSVCGLFLLLAAPFLMAATIIVYAGAIIVVFLFVLMLSQTRLASNENDRCREPLLGSLAGFCFLGLVLFALVTSSPEANAEAVLPIAPMLPAEREALLQAAAKMTAPDEPASRDDLLKTLSAIRTELSRALGGRDAAPGMDNIASRLAIANDPETIALRRQAEKLQQSTDRALTAAENKLLKGTVTESDITAVKADLAKLATDVRLLATRGDLPARTVANLGYTLYSHYLLAVELAGAVLLVATLGAVQIASRREAA